MMYRDQGNIESKMLNVINMMIEFKVDINSIMKQEENVMQRHYNLGYKALRRNIMED